MQKIKKPLHFTKWDQSIRLFPDAVRLYRKPTDNGQGRVKSKRSPRGVITGFSAHSRLRLRDSLASLALPHSTVYGLTLTVPWKDIEDASASDFYKRLFNVFGVSFRRHFPASAAIFRHELQRRKMPHTHLVFYLSHYDAVRFDDVKTEITSLWLSALRVVGFFGGSVTSAFRYSVKLDRLDGFPAMFRYLSDHASKSKQAQLGYTGKQWGILNKRVLVPHNAPVVRFASDFDLIKFNRAITKLGRFTVRFDVSPKRDYFKDFNYKKVSRRKVTSIQFVSLATSMRLAEFLGGEVLDKYFDLDSTCPCSVPSDFV